jgi:HSP20 family molecular chaperone IbpA
MGLMRALGRAGTLALAGAAAGYYLRRRGLLGQAPTGIAPAPAPPSEPLFVPQPEEPQPEPSVEEPEDVSGEVVEPGEQQPTEEFPPPEEALDPDPDEVVEPPPAADDRPDVTAVVDDLLAGEGALADAQVVASEDARVAEAVRVTLAETPGLLSAPIDIEVEGGHVTLYGELERQESIEAVERKAREVDGVRALQSRLHLPGMAAPDAR